MSKFKKLQVIGTVLAATPVVLLFLAWGVYILSKVGDQVEETKVEVVVEKVEVEPKVETKPRVKTESVVVNKVKPVRDTGRTLLDSLVTTK
jgi:hypothetical protein